MKETDPSLKDNSQRKQKGWKMYQAAIDLINNYHRNQLDKGGNPYMHHLLSVSEGCVGYDAKIAGLLHDILEDTRCKPQDLHDAGISTEVVEAVILLSKNYACDHKQYLERIKGNDIAREVKISDLKNNMDLTRLKSIGQADIKRNIRYEADLMYLLG